MIWEIAKREVITRSRTKAYRVMTVLLLFLALAGVVAAALWPDAGDEVPEVHYGADETFTPEAAARLAAFGEQFFEFIRDDSLTSSSTPDIEEALTSNEDIAVYIRDGSTLVWAKDVLDEQGLSGFLFGFLQQETAFARGAEAGLTPEETIAFLTPSEITEEFVEETDESEGVAIGLAYVSLLVSMMLPQIYGQLILMGVVEEKSSRVIEVLLSHVRPRSLLTGKVLGMGILALVQFSIVIGGLLAGLLLTDQVSIPNTIWSALPLFALFVVLGFVLYGVLFAMFGSFISRQEDGAQVMIPLFIPLFAGFMVGQTAVWGTADGLLVKIFTLFPLTSSMLVPARAARGAISTWEVVVALVLLVLTIALVVRLAARVYEFTLLRSGSRVPWREAIRLALG